MTRGTVTRGTVTRGTVTRGTVTRGTVTRGTVTRGPPVRAPPACGLPIHGTGQDAAHRAAVTGMTTADFGGAPDNPGEPAGRATDGQRAARKAPPSRRRRIAEWVVCVAIALLLAFGVRTFVFQTFLIPTTSMVPALDRGDRILVQKAFFNWHQLREGDIVVFSHPPRDHCPGPAGADLVKRVIALPGQTIYSAGGILYVDGRRLREPYLPPHDPPGPAIPGATRQDPFHVPRGEFYVMGDNRAISCDSRFWGPVKGSTIIGRVVMLLWRDDHPDLHFF
jgi:signal peptidase I